MRGPKKKKKTKKSREQKNKNKKIRHVLGLKKAAANIEKAGVKRGWKSVVHTCVFFESDDCFIKGTGNKKNNTENRRPVIAACWKYTYTFLYNTTSSS